MGTKDSTASVIDSEKVLAKAEYYKLLINSTVEGLLLHKEGVALEVNDPLLKLFGYSREDLIGKDLIDILPVPEDHMTVKDAVRSDLTIPYYARGKRKDGSIFYAEIEGKNITIDGEKCRITSVRDISDKVEAESALKQSEAKFKGLIQALPDIVLVLDYQGKVLFSNDQLELQTRYKPAELTFDVNNPLIFNEDRAFFQKQLQILKEDVRDSKITFENRYQSADGELLWFSTTLLTIDFEGQEAIQVVSRNITNSKEVELELKYHKNQLEDLVKERTQKINQLNKELLNSNNELTKLNAEISRQNIDLKTLLSQLKSTQRQLIDAEKLASVGKLTSGLSHELNNPINWIGGVIRPISQNLEEIRSRFELNDNQHLFEETFQLFNSIKEGTEKITGIINTLSDITPKGDLRKVEYINLLELVETNISTLSTRFPEVEFEVEVAENMQLHTNVIDIQHIFFNLIKNSAEAVENSAGHIHIKVTQQGDGIKAAISDNGPGMDDETQKEIYEPFFTTREEGKFLGLGLYIVKSIISKYNGNIYVNSKKDQGTVFTFSLPGVIKKAEH